MRVAPLLCILAWACQPQSDTGEPCLTDALRVLDACGATCALAKGDCDTACATEACIAACGEDELDCTDDCERTYAEATRACP